MIFVGSKFITIWKQKETVNLLPRSFYLSYLRTKYCAIKRKVTYIREDSYAIKPPPTQNIYKKTTPNVTLYCGFSVLTNEQE